MSMCRLDWRQWVFLLCVCSLSGCNNGAGDGGNDAADEEIATEDSDDVVGEEVQGEFRAIEGFWNIAEPGSGFESYLLIGGNGEAISYVEDPEGKNCFYAENRVFTSLGNSMFSMSSPDSDTGDAELELVNIDGTLEVSAESEQVATWISVDNFSAADLQICESTV